MSVSNYILNFAQLLETGELEKNTLNKDEHGMHVIVASVLKRALSSEVMASVADDFHAAYSEVYRENKGLKSKIESIENKNNDSADQVEPI